MLKWHFVTAVLATAAAVSPVSSVIQTTSGTSKRPSVSPTAAPAGMDMQQVQWFDITVPAMGAARAAVARPSGTGPFPAVVLLHGTHGFARQYVEWANDLALNGFVAVAACWFSGSGGAGVNEVTPVACPQLPPLGAGEYPAAVNVVDALIQATRGFPGVAIDRVALVGHSRGAGAAQQYLMSGGKVQAAVLHSSGYGLQPWDRAAAFNVPIMIMHGTDDDFGANTRVELARRFESALRSHGKPVDAAYCEGCGHNTFFTSPTQRRDELKKMSDFLHRHLGR